MLRKPDPVETADQINDRITELRKAAQILYKLDEQFREAREHAVKAKCDSVVFRIDKHLNKLKVIFSHMDSKFCKLQRRVEFLKNGD